MDVVATDFAEIKILRPRRLNDIRGYFCETYNARDLAAIGLDWTVVQENQSLSVAKATLRGLHFQSPPHAQHKLVRVQRGSILDVAVDIRHGSPTFGRHVSVTLDASGEQIWIPPGFAHGFCTLEPDTEVIYMTSDYYAPQHDRGIIWNDPEIGIDWPFAEAELTISDRDRRLPRLAQMEPVFALEVG